MMRVTIPGWACTVSFHPASFAAGGTDGPMYSIFPPFLEILRCEGPPVEDLESHHRSRLGAPAIRGSFSRAGNAAATRLPWSSTSVAFPGSPKNPPGPGIQRPGWVRNPHNAGAGAPESSARTGSPACGSMAGLAVREPGSDLRARAGAAASAAPGDRLLSTARPLLPASTASAVPRATLSIGPVLVGST